MSFFKCTDGHYYAISDIISIGKEREVKTRHGTSKVHQIRMKESIQAEIWSYELPALVRDNTSAIPALPNTYLISYDLDYEGDDAHRLFKAMVVAWRIGQGPLDIEPMTVDGVNDGSSDWPAILLPDGTVVQSGVQTWASLEAWEVDQRADLAERRSAGKLRTLESSNG